MLTARGRVAEVLGALDIVVAVEDRGGIDLADPLGILGLLLHTDQGPAADVAVIELFAVRVLRADAAQPLEVIEGLQGADAGPAGAGVVGAGVAVVAGLPVHGHRVVVADPGVIAGVLGARVLIFAVLWGPGTHTSCTNVGLGAGVVVVARDGVVHVDAIPVAAADIVGAGVPVVAVLLGPDAGPGLAPIADGAGIAVVAGFVQGIVDAVPVAAVVVGAGVVVVAVPAVALIVEARDAALDAVAEGLAGRLGRVGHGRVAVQGNIRGNVRCVYRRVAPQGVPGR